jgi:hypothetical protein
VENASYGTLLPLTSAKVILLIQILIFRRRYLRRTDGSYQGSGQYKLANSPFSQQRYSHPACPP